MCLVWFFSDNIWDFGALTYVWCKFMFPYKPPSNGLYPYYRNCFMHDYRINFFCYDPGNHTLTRNTFVVGYWDNDWVFWTFTPNTDLIQPYKCCQTPPGYYIDYVSCYYIPTHDLYWEYYDGNYFLVNCATGYVVTGTAAKFNPIHQEYRIDWVQCCRLGYGAVTALPPPVIQRPGKPPAYVASHNTVQTDIPQAYQHQYRRRKRSALPTESNSIAIGNQTVFAEDPLPADHIHNLRAQESQRHWENAEFFHSGSHHMHPDKPYSGRVSDYDLPGHHFVNTEIPFFHPDVLNSHA
ncbi:uncharacterized protein LOC129588392 [Paramacrobiotus metropolitanus]|uniref:uncharacterized protein LOC129588392 n=1 Tax=Paramacrobiotus metropolitanus TaxID=2943436 RepID=UPI00244620C8|nr:uncharacterized protein LOC129588392 [Paramacrobiotus metropolitanus]